LKQISWYYELRIWPDRSFDADATPVQSSVTGEEGVDCLQQIFAKGATSSHRNSGEKAIHHAVWLSGYNNDGNLRLSNP
jgi:hypothetical protein